MNSVDDSKNNLSTGKTAPQWENQQENAGSETIVVPWKAMQICSLRPFYCGGIAGWGPASCAASFFSYPQLSLCIAGLSRDFATRGDHSYGRKVLNRLRRRPIRCNANVRSERCIP